MKSHKTELNPVQKAQHESKISSADDEIVLTVNCDLIIFSFIFATSTFSTRIRGVY